MLRDVFYYGSKPNAHPREKHAIDLADARQQCTTEHFWIIDEYCDYTNFDWDWDFDFLPDEEVWTSEHNNVWPSPYQKDSGTWLCSEQDSEIIIYRADVEPIPRKNAQNYWKIHYEIDKSSFDFNWHPDPTSPPYIYVFGNTQYLAEIMPTVEYHVPGATEYKFIEDISMRAKLSPNSTRFEHLENCDGIDYSWHPDPWSPPYIYAWGNQWNKPEDKISIQYVVEGATEYKYMEQRAKRKPCMDNWEIPPYVIKNSFDFSWEPNPHDPPYVYQFGTIHQKTGGPRYTVLGATELKYIDDVKAQVVAWRFTNWLIPKNVDQKSFDFSWHPDDTEPAYIYQFPSTWSKTGGPKFTVEGSSETKYLDYPIAKVKQDMTHWSIPIGLDTSEFDFSWHPDITDNPFIYQFGTQWQKTNGPMFTAPGCNETTPIKYMDILKAKRIPDKTNWITPIGFDESKFDFSWHPDSTSPPYIYQFGTIADPNNGPRYMVEGATEIVNLEQVKKDIFVDYPKYYIETTLKALVNQHKDEIFWALNSKIDYSNFDFNWRPNIQQAQYIHAFGSSESETTQTYFVNANMWANGYKEINWVKDEKLDAYTLANLFKKPNVFFVDKGNKESAIRFEYLKLQFPDITKTRYLNSWVDTINRCINKSTTELCWILNSELDYTSFDFNYYPNPWQMTMVHVFGTQWSHWGSTFMVNKETFAEDTKYVKIIEHLRNLNFVKTKRAFASNCLYDVYLIDYGNEGVADIVSLIESKTKRENVYTIKYENDYLTTLKNMLYELGIKKDHYIWVCSSICDYTRFDFTYICDPFSLEQLHVFPSDLQKFGDTFFINVNKLRILVEDLDKLENIEKINFNQHQRVKRLAAPSFVTDADTHLNFKKHSYNFPYAVFTTSDNLIAPTNNDEPISMWSKESKNILITNMGGTRIVVPKEANDYVEKELYDYPYIAKSTKMGQSKPLDIVFLSNGEAGADENYEHLLNVTKGLKNRVVRVDGVNGRVAAYHAAAEASQTSWMFTVFAKLKVNSKFDWTWQPDRLQIPKHYIFYASNPVNGLVYGHQAMIAYNKQITLSNMGKGLDFTLDSEHEVVEINSGVAKYNIDEFSTWRTSFREAIKLRLDDSTISRHRLKIWSTVGEGEFAQYSIQGALNAIEYFEQVNGELDKLRLSYDWPWLQEYFNRKSIKV